jgi:hypothetical protein
MPRDARARRGRILRWRAKGRLAKRSAAQAGLSTFAFSLDHVRQLSERRVPRRAGTSVSFEQLQDPHHRSFQEFSCPAITIISRSREAYIELVMEALLTIFLSLGQGFN